MELLHLIWIQYNLYFVFGKSTNFNILHWVKVKFLFCRYISVERLTSARS